MPPAPPALKSATTAATLVLMAVSGGMLWDLGYNYDGVTGSPLTKIHPFTYFIFAALLWRAVQSGNPIAYVEAALKRRPAACWLLVLSGLLVVVTVLRAGPGMAGFIDTFGGPAAYALILDEFDETDLKPLRLVLHAVMTVNALMALFEFATHHLIFPYRLDGVAFDDTRSTALQGHPLINAALTAIYVLSLMTGAKSLRPSLRAVLIPLQFAALVVFGGRTAIVVSLTLTPLVGVYSLFAAMRRGRVSLLGAAAAVGAAPLAALAVLLVFVSGLADPLLMRFVSDSGSAETRVIMFDMLRPFTLGQLIVGPDIEQVESLRRHFGLELGVENPFVRMILYEGGFVMATVFLSLLWYFRELLRGRGFRLVAPLVATAVLLNASESISVKTDILDKLTLIFVCLFPHLRAARRALSPSAVSPVRVRRSNGRQDVPALARSRPT